LTILAKKISLIKQKFQKLKVRREEKKYLRGAFGKCTFFIAWEKQLSIMDATGKLYRYQEKLSAI
jgi:hypothetical protein